MRRPTPNDPLRTEYFSVFEGNYHTDQEGDRLYWFVSSQKRRRDQLSRQERLLAAEAGLAELAPKLKAYHLKRKADILRAVHAILEKQQLEGLLTVRLETCS